jgi:hypothetical protein
MKYPTAAGGTTILPHPCPLPLGEGKWHSALRKFAHWIYRMVRRKTGDPRTLFPLPAGEGQGEGEASRFLSVLIPRKISRTLGIALVFLTLILLAHGMQAAAAPHPRYSTKEFKVRFLKFCDLAAAELNKPITPFYSRTDADPATHHMPFFEDGHAVRALAVAYDMTGKRAYLDACRRWANLMIVYQRGMNPAGAYYMNHQRAPGQATGQWNLADSGSVGMGVLATATRCKDPTEKARYIASAKTLAKLAMENYVKPEGGISNGLWPESDGPWWASTAIFGTLAFVLYEETGEEQYLNVGKAGVRWLVRTDFHDFKPITFEQRASGIIFYTFEFYLAALKHFPPDSSEHQAILKQFDSALEWMAKNQKSRGANIPDYVEKNVDLAGLPYLMYGFAGANPRFRDLTPLADGELDYIGKLLLANGDPNVSKLMVWEVMTWGMLSHAERLKPGALLRGSRTPTNRRGIDR